MDAADDEPDKDVPGAEEGDHTMQAVVGRLSCQDYMLLLLLLLLHHNYIACNGRWKEGRRDMQCPGFHTGIFFGTTKFT